MNDDDYLQKIKQLVNDRKFFVLQRDVDLITWIKSKTSFLNQEAKYIERIFHLFNENQTDICEYGQRKHFKSLNKGYMFCSSTCRCKKEKQSKVIRAYESSISESEKHRRKEKAKLTFLKNYGVDNPLKNEDIFQKVKTTNKQKYGVENQFQREEVKKYIEELNLETYGVCNLFESKIIQDKIKSTNKQKYGVEYPSQNTKIKDKMQKTCIEKYGCQNPFENDEIKIKIKEINKALYGAENPRMRHISPETLEILLCKKKFSIFVSQKSTKQIAEELSVSISRVNIAFREFEAERQIRWDEENNVRLFLNSLNRGDWKKDRKLIYPKEIDLLNEELKIGVEYSGLFWHSDKMGKTKDYHLNKTKNANIKGYRIIQIFEDEWLFKRNIVKSRLRNILGVSEKGTGARNLEVKQISSKLSKLFLEKYHLQGSGHGGFVKYGAFHNDVLVAVMTFSKTRRSLGSIELLRFATDGKNYPGIASKILKRFIAEFKPKKIISYVDRRWSDGGLYKSLGFIEEKSTVPNHWYFKQNELKRLRSFKKFFVENGNNKTESQIAKELNYLKIWDCGNLKFSITIDK